MKKVILSTLLFSSLLGASIGSVHAADTSDTTTHGKATFTTPTTGGLTMTDTTALDLDFGSNEISATDQTYSNGTETKATVQDIRGTATGWTLTVAQGTQFTTADSDVLTNAQMTIKTPTLDATSTATAKVASQLILTPGGAAQAIMGAAAGEGNGTAIATMATGAVELAVPGKTVKVAKDYTTTLTWNLADTPANM